jgi:hypothetical protein
VKVGEVLVPCDEATPAGGEVRASGDGGGALFTQESDAEARVTAETVMARKKVRD